MKNLGEKILVTGGLAALATGGSPTLTSCTKTKTVRDTVHTTTPGTHSTDTVLINNNGDTLTTHNGHTDTARNVVVRGGEYGIWMGNTGGDEDKLRAMEDYKVFVVRHSYYKTDVNPNPYATSRLPKNAVAGIDISHIDPNDDGMKPIYQHMQAKGWFLHPSAYPGLNMPNFAIPEACAYLAGEYAKISKAKDLQGNQMHGLQVMGLEKVIKVSNSSSKELMEGVLDNFLAPLSTEVKKGADRHMIISDPRFKTTYPGTESVAERVGKMTHEVALNFDKTGPIPDAEYGYDIEGLQDLQHGGKRDIVVYATINLGSNAVDSAHINPVARDVKYNLGKPSREGSTTTSWSVYAYTNNTATKSNEFLDFNNVTANSRQQGVIAHVDEPKHNMLFPTDNLPESLVFKDKDDARYYNHATHSFDLPAHPPLAQIDASAAKHEEQLVLHDKGTGIAG